MSEDSLRPTDPAMAAQLEHWRDITAAPRARAAWRGSAKYVTAALLLLFAVPAAVRFLVFSPLIETVGFPVHFAIIIALPLAVIYGVFRILR